jgi:hypothetical protein
MPSIRRAPPSARERIGGRWAISLQLAVVTAATIALASVVPLGGIVTSPFDRASATPTAVAAQIAAVWLVLLVAHLTLFRRRAERPVPAWWVFALGVVGSAVRVAVQALFAERDGAIAYGAATVVLAVLAIGALGSLVPPVTAYLLATRDWYSRERELLIARAAQAEAERLRAVGALRDAALAAVRGDLDRARAVMTRDDARPDDVAAALLAAATGGVRPAAHALIGRPPPAPPRVSVREVLTSELHRAPLPILVPAIGTAFLIAPRALVAQGPVAAVALPALAVVGILAAFPVGRALIRRRPRLALPITAAACLAAMTPTGVLLGVGFPSASPVVVVAAIALLAFAIVVAAGMTAAAQEVGEEALAALDAPIRQAELERAAADRARDMLLQEIGLHLHGTVQSGLVSASYAIRQALESGDEEALAAAMARARAVLDAGAAFPDGEPGDDAEALARDWEGVLDVEWRLGDPDWPVAAGVVRECLANAVVHGGAGRAVVEVASDGDDLLAVVTDDGAGPRHGPRGVGADVLDRATGGRWEIAPGPGGGAVVTARIVRPSADADSG